MSSKDQITIERIIDHACAFGDMAKPRKALSGVGMGQLGRSRASLGKAWSALNKWALEKLVGRGSIRIPNFMTVGWQRFRGIDGEVRLRPVFVLSEGFCRAHGLPHKRLLRPPLLMESPEVVNYTKLAIRYTSFMTKDVIYVALRDVIRRIGNAMGQGAEVNVAFSFGTLEAKERKFRFVFDLSVLHEDETAAATSRSSSCGRLGGPSAREHNGLSSSRSSDSAGEVKSESMPQISADGGCRELDVNDGCSRSRETPSGTPRQNRPPAKAERQNFGQLRDHIIPEKGKADDNEATEDVVERERAEEMAAEWPRPSKRFGKRKNILQEKVWDSYFRDYVTALEGQAQDNQTLARRRQDLLQLEDKREAEKRRRKQSEMDDLLMFVKGQVREVKERRAREVEDARRGCEEEDMLRAGRERANQAFEGSAWRAPDWGPRKARGLKLSREDLVSSHEQQMRDRAEEELAKGRTRLEEEKAATEKLQRERREEEDRKKLAKTESMRELKRSWQKQEQINTLKWLAKQGPEAVRKYASNENIINKEKPSQASLGYGTSRTGWMQPGRRSFTGPSKLYVKGLCRYRYRPPESAENGGGGVAKRTTFARTSRRPSTTHSEAPPSIGFDSRRTARIM